MVMILGFGGFVDLSPPHPIAILVKLLSLKLPSVAEKSAYAKAPSSPGTPICKRPAN
jgi:hypothetical protein